MNRSSRPARPKAQTPPKRRILVFTEGEATEVIYLTHLYRQNREKVAVVIDTRHGTPLTIVRHAVAERETCVKDERRGRGTGFDSYWCVIDVDEHPDLAEARQVAQRHRINLAVSNPCIELWFVLHLEDQFAYIHRHEVQHRSAELFGFDKRPHTKTLVQLSTLYPVAKARAEALDLMHEQNCSPEGSNPSTSIAPLVEAIMSLSRSDAAAVPRTGLEPV